MDFCVLLKFDESDCVYVIWFYLCWNNTSDERTRGGHKTRQCFASLCVRKCFGFTVCQKRLIYVFIFIFFNST